MRRPLVKESEIPELMAVCHAIEGTQAYVLELLAFGPDYSSCYVLLRSRAILTDRAAASRIGEQPSRFGNVLKFGRDLERDAQTATVYFIGDPPRTRS